MDLDAEAWIALIGIVVTSLVVIVIAAKQSASKRLTWEIESVELVRRTSHGGEGRIKVLVDDREVAQPRSMTVTLRSRGRRDVRSEDFDQGRPCTIELGREILERVEATDRADAIRTDGSKVLIGPLLLPRGQHIRASFLVAGGRSSDTEFESTLADVAVTRESARRQRRWLRPSHPHWAISGALLAGGAAALATFFGVFLADGARDLDEPDPRPGFTCTEVRSKPVVLRCTTSGSSSSPTAPTKALPTPLPASENLAVACLTARSL